MDKRDDVSSINFETEEREIRYFHPSANDNEQMIDRCLSQ